MMNLIHSNNVWRLIKLRSTDAKLSPFIVLIFWHTCLLASSNKPFFCLFDFFSLDLRQRARGAMQFCCGTCHYHLFIKSNSQFLPPFEEVVERFLKVPPVTWFVSSVWIETHKTDHSTWIKAVNVHKNDNEEKQTCEDLIRFSNTPMVCAQKFTVCWKLLYDINQLNWSPRLKHLDWDTWRPWTS